jgi:cyclic beta-1,2-glucan synthetase
VPALHLLGNGRLSSWITDTGGGGLRWQEHALTRWRADPSRDDDGIRVYVRDEESGDQWPAVPRPGEGARSAGAPVFHPHLAEYHRRDHGIGLHLEVAVAAVDDVEVRRFTIANETDRPRTLTLTSYAEVVLAPSSDDERHPAFSKLFVRSEWVGRMEGLLFARRPRDVEERPPVLLHRLVKDDPGIELVGFEADRCAFLGRQRDTRAPLGQVRSSPVSTGFTLDPIASLCVQVKLDPGQVQRLAFVTVVSGSSESVLETAARYQAMSALDWLIADASASKESSAFARHRAGCVSIRACRRTGAAQKCGFALPRALSSSRSRIPRMLERASSRSRSTVCRLRTDSWPFRPTAASTPSPFGSARERTEANR